MKGSNPMGAPAGKGCPAGKQASGVFPGLFLVFLGLVLVMIGCAPTPRELRPHQAPGTAREGIDEGRRCPNLVFEDERGRSRELREYRGRIVFLNFWASWCIPCQHEMPSIQKLYDDLKGEKDVAFLLLCTKKDFDKSRSWARSLGYSLPLFKSTPRDGQALTVSRIPRTLILDRNGIVILSRTGDQSWNLWREQIQNLARLTVTVPAQRRWSIKADGVRIDAETAAGNAASSLRLTLVPNKGMKLSSKYGITVTPSGGQVDWVTPTPYALIDEGRDYFAADPAITLEYRAAKEAVEIDLKIEYGYCQSGSGLCVPVEKRIKLPVDPEKN